MVAGRDQRNELSMREIKIVTPDTIQEVNTNASLTAHETEFGGCIHDYISSPCSMYRNCIGWSEQVCMNVHYRGWDNSWVLFRETINLTSFWDLNILWTSIFVIRIFYKRIRLLRSMQKTYSIVITLLLMPMKVAQARIVDTR